MSETKGAASGPPPALSLVDGSHRLDAHKGNAWAAFLAHVGITEAEAEKYMALARENRGPQSDLPAS